MIDHIAFVVEDPVRTAAMLQKFGYRIYRQTEHHGCAIALEHEKQPGLIIELTQKRQKDSIGFNHVCFRVDGQEMYETLEKEGISFTGAPHFSAESGRYITNCVDEDQIKWQITF